MTNETNTNTENTAATDLPFDLPATELNENGNTPAQQKAADLKAGKAKTPKAPKAPKAPKEPKAPTLAVQDVVLAGMKLADEDIGADPTDLTRTGNLEDEGFHVIGAKAILERLGQLIPANNCTSIAWYRNAVKSGKRTLPTLEQAMSTWTTGDVPPKAPRKNAVATKVATAKEDDLAYAAAMDEWARQQGINVDAEGGYELSVEQLAQFEAQHIAG